MKPHTISLIIVFIFLAACSTDADLAFQDWDENKDGVITKGEYDKMKPYLNLFEQWDKDENSAVTEEEWRSGVNDFYPDKDESDYGNFSDWDLNNDGSITSEDFAERIFDLWDMNDDNTLNEEEFTEWYPEYKFTT